MKKENPLEEVFGIWKDKPTSAIISQLEELSTILMGGSVTMELEAEDYHTLQAELLQYMNTAYPISLEHKVSFTKVQFNQ